MIQKFKGKTALITGASRGIGKAIAIMLAKNGFNIALCGRDKEELEEVSSGLRQFGILTLVCAGDITEESVITDIINNTVDTFGGLDVLINNAGIAVPNPIESTTTNDFDLHISTNVRAPFLFCKYAIEHLRKSDCATIINMSSVVGYKGYANQGVYTASKHALLGFTKVLAQEVQKDGIRVHVIAPGGVNTDMVAATRPDIDLTDLISTLEIADIAEFLLTHRGNAMIDEINVRRASNTPWK